MDFLPCIQAAMKPEIGPARRLVLQGSGGAGGVPRAIAALMHPGSGRLAPRGALPQIHGGSSG